MNIEQLRQVPLFANLSEEQLQCVATLGTEVKREAGDQLANQGDPPDGFYIILEGQTEWFRNVEGEDVSAVTLETGDVFAELILLLDEPYPTSGRALTAVDLYKLTPDEFWKMLEICPGVMRSVLKIAAQRSQIHETVTQQQAKLMSLGTLSAGLAHELNNPASAVRRNVQTLETILQKLPILALKLHSSEMTQEQLTFLTELYQQLASAQTAVLDPLAQSEAEDTVSDWLEAHNIENSWKLAPTFVAAGLTVDRLTNIVDRIEPTCLSSTVTWLEATLTGTKLLEEIDLSSVRISELIKSMKDYSQMDQTPLQEIDIHEGIESTLTILKHKLKYGVAIEREYGDLPKIYAYGRELNQVWTNLIDNAVDAMNGKGELTIRTLREQNDVIVEIQDTGSGIPDEIRSASADISLRSRVFEPFFTTKGVGAGTGLGLDITRRIVAQRHHGDISFDSKPGETKFRIRLPIQQAR
ncbi:ATP-binding protein [Phormidesmis priestleyi]